VTIELPDVPATRQLTPEEVRLELACALYARGRIGKVTGAEMAGVDLFTFQHALGERGVSLYSGRMLEDELQALKEVFPQ